MTETICLYHGTNTASADDIMTKGFGRGYLTQSLEQAQYYADEAVDQSDLPDQKPVVLTVAVSADCLRVDLRSIEEPSTEVREKHGIGSESDFFDALEGHSIGWPESDNDWQYSLFLTDCVLHKPQGDRLGKAFAHGTAPDHEIGLMDLDFDPLEPCD